MRCWVRRRRWPVRHKPIYHRSTTRRSFRSGRHTRLRLPRCRILRGIVVHWSTFYCSYIKRKRNNYNPFSCFVTPTGVFKSFEVCKLLSGSGILGHEVRYVFAQRGSQHKTLSIENNEKSKIVRKQLISISVVVLAVTVALAAMFSLPSSAADSCTPSGTTYGTDTLSVTVPSTGTYSIWTRMQIPDSADNGILLNIDNTSCYNVGANSSLATGSWQWVNY